LFAGVVAPPAGLAKLYVFRPTFSAELSSQQPALLIDGQSASSLVSGQYSSHVLSPGPHQISLVPQRFEASLWKSETVVLLEADKLYFLAIWNNTERSSGFSLIPGGKKLPFLMMPTTSTRSTEVQYELVPMEEALPAVSEMREVQIPSSASGAGP
jgi:hypothetical protein